ncbi:MAG TPA: PhzF family phenazine biosynthesis isomerase, partial [Thermoanaerobaculia bacterium]|nr:PhzF family phenazine biosynthesis isomerase [Thermoanaerobaculia bacterium]
MRLKQYQVDAFTERPFGGNPAAVVPLAAWLPDELLQAIAEENNLSETAFYVPRGPAYELRWFTPAAEVDLCGHATLATAHVLFTHEHASGDAVTFHTRSGDLVVRRSATALEMDFPARVPAPVDPPPRLVEALGVTPL